MKSVKFPFKPTLLIATAIIGAASFGFGPSRPKPTPSPTPTPSHSSVGVDHPANFKKVFIVVLENTSANDAVKTDYLGKTVKPAGAYLNQFFAITHPSEPNYLAMVGGSTFGITDDNNHTIDAQSIADLLEAKGKTWRAYAEGYPGTPTSCFLGATKGKYARKHVPFLSFKNISTNTARCANVVNSNQLQSDIDHGTLADYSMFVPNLDDDGHDQDVNYASKWFKTAFASRLADPNFMRDLLLVVTFDEDDKHNGNHIYTLLYGDPVTTGAQSENHYDFYSLLRTIEDTWGLGTLGTADGTADETATPITGVWK